MPSCQSAARSQCRVGLVVSPQSAARYSINQITLSRLDCPRLLTPRILRPAARVLMSDLRPDAAGVARDIHTRPHTTIHSLTNTKHLGESPSHTPLDDPSHPPARQPDATFPHHRTNDSTSTSIPTPPPTRSSESSLTNTTAYAHNHAPLPTINHHPPLSHRLSGTPALAGLTIQTDLSTPASTIGEKPKNTGTPSISENKAQSSIHN